MRRHVPQFVKFKQKPNISQFLILRNNVKWSGLLQISRWILNNNYNFKNEQSCQGRSRTVRAGPAFELRVVKLSQTQCLTLTLPVSQSHESSASQCRCPPRPQSRRPQGLQQLQGEVCIASLPVLSLAAPITPVPPATFFKLVTNVIMIILIIESESQCLPVNLAVIMMSYWLGNCDLPFKT